jgi:hypothetical protein
MVYLLAWRGKLCQESLAGHRIARAAFERSSKARCLPHKTSLARENTSAEKGTNMFCNGCNNSYLWLIIILIILFGWNGNGCGCGCGCDNGNNGCGCC